MAQSDAHFVYIDYEAHCDACGYSERYPTYAEAEEAAKHHESEVNVGIDDHAE